MPLGLSPNQKTDGAADARTVFYQRVTSTSQHKPTSNSPKLSTFLAYRRLPPTPYIFAHLRRRPIDPKRPWLSSRTTFPSPTQAGALTIFQMEEADASTAATVAVARDQDGRVTTFVVGDGGRRCPCRRPGPPRPQGPLARWPQHPRAFTSPLALRPAPKGGAAAPGTTTDGAPTPQVGPKVERWRPSHRRTVGATSPRLADRRRRAGIAPLRAQAALAPARARRQLFPSASDKRPSPRPQPFP